MDDLFALSILTVPYAVWGVVITLAALLIMSIMSNKYKRMHYTHCVYISKNNIQVLNIKTGNISTGTANFSTERLLVGDINIAEKLLSDLLKQVIPKIGLRPKMIVQPLDYIVGGLSPVEERILRELCEASGAAVVKVHVGDKITKEVLLSNRF